MDNKVVDIALPYCELGKWKEKVFPISFISAGIYQDYELLCSEQASFLRKVFGKALNQRVDKEDKEAGKDVIEKRAELICYILEDNGCKGDVTPRWLNRKVRPQDLDTFLEACLTKDLDDDKKKELEQAMNSVSELLKPS